MRVIVNHVKVRHVFARERCGASSTIGAHTVALIATACCGDSNSAARVSNATAQLIMYPTTRIYT
jgi:hypothetical protein